MRIINSVPAHSQEPLPRILVYALEQLSAAVSAPCTATQFRLAHLGACRIVLGAKIYCMPFPAAEVTMGKRRKKLQGTVQKIIKPLDPSQAEKAQIDIQGADDLYREIRIDNE